MYKIYISTMWKAEIIFQRDDNNRVLAQDTIKTPQNSQPTQTVKATDSPCIQQRQPNHSYLLEEHKRRIHESIEQIDVEQICIPKPRSKVLYQQQYCAVCRQYYEDYMGHVEMERHKEKLKNSQWQRFILEEEIKMKGKQLIENREINCNQKYQNHSDNHNNQETLDQDQLLNSYLDLKAINQN